MDVSLDEIIKKNKIGKQKSRRNGRNRPANAPKPQSNLSTKSKKSGIVKKSTNAPPVKKVAIPDLRMLIGSKAKTPIRDAREKLAKKPRIDARERLSRSNRAAEMLGRTSRGKLDILPRRTIENRSRKPAYMDMEDSRMRRRSGSLLFRTIDNHFSPVEDEIMDVDTWDQPSIQDITRFQSITRTFSQDDGWHHHPPQPHQMSHIPRRSNGLKGRLEPSRLPQDEGYRIVVSNLQPSVTHEDIKELFEDIGILYNSRVVRPGTAEVIYKTLEDAMKAVDTYHNRQLDGQPMKCLLVKPSNVTKMVSSKGLVVPDLHAIHKALFNK